jgi:hypothetical protein
VLGSEKEVLGWNRPSFRIPDEADLALEAILQILCCLIFEDAPTHQNPTRVWPDISPPLPWLLTF